MEEMSAVLTSADGGPDKLYVGKAPVPSLGPGQALIRVAASGVNRADVLQRQGHYPSPPGESDIIGLEICGTVVSSSLADRNYTPGKFICGVLPGGGYAQYARIDQSLMLDVPPHLDPIDAAGLPEAACTVWSNLAMQARLQPGEIVLIHGGGSGIGTHAIQVAKHILGATVAVTAGSDEKLQRCVELGADIAINYRTDDFATKLRTETHGRGADVILDIIGAKYLERNIGALNDDGRLIIIGMMGGATTQLNIGQLLHKRATISATNLRNRPVTGKGSKTEIVDQVRTHVWPRIADGTITPVVSAVKKWSEAGAAHELLDSPHTFGKVILVPPQTVSSQSEDYTNDPNARTN